MKPSITVGSFKLPQMLLAAGALLLLVALWIGWGGWQLRAAHALTDQVNAARRQVADQLQPDLKAALDRMGGLKGRKALVLALRSNDTNAAKDIVTQGWTGVEAVEFVAPDLAVAYADPAAVG